MTTQFLSPQTPKGTITLTLDLKALRFIHQLATLAQCSDEDFAAAQLTERLSIEGENLMAILQDPQINISEYDPTAGPPLTDQLAEDYTRWLENRTENEAIPNIPPTIAPPAPPSPLQPLTGGPPSPPPPPAAEPPTRP